MLTSGIDDENTDGFLKSVITMYPVRMNSSYHSEMNALGHSRIISSIRSKCMSWMPIIVCQDFTRILMGPKTRSWVAS